MRISISQNSEYQNLWHKTNNQQMKDKLYIGLDRKSVV